MTAKTPGNDLRFCLTACPAKPVWRAERADKPKILAANHGPQAHKAVAAAILASLILLGGCGGLASSNGTATAQISIQVSPSTLNFGNLAVGKKVSQTVSVSNTGSTALTVSSDALSGSQFSISGLSTPMTLAGGQSNTFEVWFDPTATGTFTGTLTIQANSGAASSQVALSGVATATPQQILLTASSLNLGSVKVGSTASSTLTINNVGAQNLAISLISVSGAPFGVSGITTPATIAPNGSATLNVTFSPTIAGTDSGSITIASNDPQTPSSAVTLSGTGTAAAVAPTITTQPASQTVTAGQTATFTVVANGTAPLSYQWQQNGVNITGATSSSYTTPATATSQSGTNFDVIVSNSAGSAMSATATLEINAATTAPTITTQPVSQTVTAGQTATFSVVANGTGPLSYQWQQNGVNIAGATASSYTTSATTTSQSGTKYDVVVSNSAGSVTSTSATLTVSAVPAPAIQVNSSVTFTSTVVGTTSSQAFFITNTGTATLSITQVNESGAAFSVGSFSSPLNIGAGQQTTISVSFNPTAAGSASGSLSIVSNAPTSPTVVTLSGTGVAATLTLGISPATVAFGNVTTGTSGTGQNVTITNTGNANVAISQIALSGTGYSMTGGGPPVTLSPTQNVVLAVMFSPRAVGTVNGSISIVSNASGSPATVSLSGNGVAPVQHSVALSWTASTSTIVGYNVHRGTVSGGPYTKINSSLTTTLTYTDSTVQSGTTYYYVATAVDSTGNESVDSNEVSAQIP
jgi:hypothetical protein